MVSAQAPDHLEEYELNSAPTEKFPVAPLRGKTIRGMAPSFVGMFWDESDNDFVDGVDEIIAALSESGAAGASVVKAFKVDGLCRGGVVKATEIRSDGVGWINRA